MRLNANKGQKSSKTKEINAKEQLIFRDLGN